MLSFSSFSDLNKMVFFLFLFLMMTGKGSTQPPILPQWYDEDGCILSGAMSGGFLAPQFSMFDLNRNGRKELIIHDRYSGLISVWEHMGGTEYRWAGDKIKIEWPEINSWMLIRDFNRDGIPDIFTQGFHGIAVYEGYRSGATLKFRAMGGESFIDDSLIFTTKGQRKVNIYHGQDDIPVIADVDGDGDLDIMTFDPQGTYLHYYENLSNETGKDFDFVLRHQCWGNFVESLLGNEVVLSGDPEVCPPPFSKRHSGGASAIIDLNQNGVPDLLVGDRDFPYLKALYNEGSADSGFITRIDTFPFQGDRALLHDFPAPYVLDVNQDGREDVVIAHNDYPKNDLEGILLYRHTGRQDPGFEKVTDQWLQEEILDLGQYTAPLFIHIDGGENPDLLVAYNRTTDDRGPENRLAYFRAIGEDGYQLITDDFLSDEMALVKGGYQPGLAAGDIDGDGDTDILITLSDGSCFLFENGSGDPRTFELQTMHPQWLDLDLPSGASPEFYDIDGDGDLDLIAGNDQGTIHLFRNTGTPHDPRFDDDLSHPENVSRLGNIRTTKTGEIIGRSAPRVIETKDHEVFLATGSRSGKLTLYDINFSALTDDWNPVPSEFPALIGKNSRIAFRSMEDGDIYLLAGNVSGGLTDGMSSWIKTSVDLFPDDEKPEIFPNPVASGQSLHVSWNDLGDVWQISVFQMNGINKMHSKTSSPYMIDTAGWAPGMYFLRLSSDRGRVVALPFVVQ